jgi:serine/threonine protein kinase
VGFVEDSALPALTALEPGAMVGEYRVERLLGQGGMASVFGAIHPLIGKRAAIKVMSPSLSVDASAVARFVREAQAVNRIGHPNIVDVFSFGRLSDGRSYFVMEWLQGESLFERLTRQHPVPLPDVVHILDQVCDALEAAHDNDIVHRDLKPANVFLTTVRGRFDRVKLLDFGVAKLAHQDPPGQTGNDCVLGTPEYIAPEQARGRDIDTRADLYSLGVMAYEMVMGRLPFLSDNAADAIQMHLSVPPPRPSILWPAIPTALEEMLLGLLAKDADERPSLAMVRAVLAALKPTATPALDRVAAAPPPRLLRRRRHLWRLGAVAATSMTLALVGYRPTHTARRAEAASEQVVARAQVVAAVTPSLVPPSAAPSFPAAPSLVPPASRHAAVGAPGSQGHAHKLHRHVRDGNYLLNPFTSH